MENILSNGSGPDQTISKFGKETNKLKEIHSLCKCEQSSVVVINDIKKTDEYARYVLQKYPVVASAMQYGETSRVDRMLRVFDLKQRRESGMLSDSEFSTAWFQECVDSERTLTDEELLHFTASANEHKHTHNNGR